MANVLAVVILASIAAILTLFTIIGNAMVILAFKVNIKLRILSNYCLVSLAVSDLTVGIFLMPVYTAYLFLGYWPFGWIACYVWLSMDYALCTASIANLLIIALDRYLLVTQPLEYKAFITPKKMGSMITSAWIFAFLVWPPWIFAWPYIEGRGTVPNQECYVQFLKTNPVLSTIVSAISFYIPVTITVVLYISLYIKNEQRRLQRRRMSTPFILFHSLATNNAREKTNNTLHCCTCLCLPYKFDRSYDDGEERIKVVGKSYHIDIEDENIPNGRSCANQNNSDKGCVSSAQNNSTDSVDNHTPDHNIGTQNTASLHELDISRLAANTDQLKDPVSKVLKQNSRTNRPTCNPCALNPSSDSHHNKRMVKILTATLLTLIISNAPYYTAAVVGSYCDGCVNLIFYGVGKHVDK